MFATISKTQNYWTLWYISALSRSREILLSWNCEGEDSHWSNTTLGSLCGFFHGINFILPNKFSLVSFPKTAKSETLNDGLNSPLSITEGLIADTTPLVISLSHFRINISWTLNRFVSPVLWGSRFLDAFILLYWLQLFLYLLMFLLDQRLHSEH